MNSDETDAWQMALDSLANSLPEAQWLTLGEGRRVLTLPRRALDASDAARWLRLESAPAGPPADWSHLCLLSELPSQAILDALDPAVGPLTCVAWPGELSGPEAFGLEPFGRLIVDRAAWTVAWWRRGDKPAAAALGAAPKPNEEDLIEDLDARARWFKKRH
jgi:hypothetical protein